MKIKISVAICPHPKMSQHAEQNIERYNESDDYPKKSGKGCTQETFTMFYNPCVRCHQKLQSKIIKSKKNKIFPNSGRNKGFLGAVEVEYFVRAG